MLLKQIILTKGVPFEIKLNHPYTKAEMIYQGSAHQMVWEV